MTEPQTDPWAQAEQIVRAHEEVCAGTEPEAPWCCCAPDGTPLCPACKCLADKIAAALAEVCAQVETLTAERDELWGANHLNANALRLAKEGQATLRAQVDRIKELLLQTAAPTAADGSWDSVSAVQWLIEQHDASLATVEPEPTTTCRCLAGK